MIKTHSDDPDVAAAAAQAAGIIKEVLESLPKATSFDYGGHQLQLGDYGLCERCTAPIAEAQQAYHALKERAEGLDSELVAEHVQLAAQLLAIEADAAELRAELHNGQNSEPILNQVLGFIHDRQIHDSYDHSHTGGN